MDTTSLFTGMILGAIGGGYVLYGKKQHKGIALLSGVILCVLPYFIPNLILLILVSLALMAAPFYFQF